LVGAAVLLAIPVALSILSAIASFLALYGHVILSVMVFACAVAVGGFLAKSVVADFAETGGNFDIPGTVLLMVKLLSFVCLAIALIIILINAFREPNLAQETWPNQTLQQAAVSCTARSVHRR
jgi:hypothetical protein